MKSRAMSLVVLIALIACGALPAVVHGSELAGREVNVPEIIAALKTNDMSAQEIRMTESYTRLNVVDLSAIKQSDDSLALEDALRTTDDGWAMVQTAIVANDLIAQELRRRAITIRGIVAATMDDDRVITVYIR